ncbi:MAG TPA: nucleotidyltransferase family protein [Rhizomicrobium sp.]|jgi:molybdenum cofactor cytidylyltransferase|nr:nucleotidyltransferase family protein [Rhizomicrobium sp.]
MTSLEAFQLQSETDHTQKLPRPRIAAVVLAAGLSTRMGRNKLLAEIDGEPLIRRVIDRVESSGARPIVVVTGHDPERLRQALEGPQCTIVHNPQFREGLATSLRTGIAAVPACDGAIILLGDMPAISASLIDRMIRAFDPENGRAICVAVHNGRRGNPVLFHHRFFSELQSLAGDIGARNVVTKHMDVVCEVEAGDDGCLLDIDTPEDLAGLERGH